MINAVMEYRAKLASLTPHNKQIWDLAHKMMNEMMHSENADLQNCFKASTRHHDASRKAEMDLLELLAIPAAQPAPGWVSVKDAMPKYSENGPEFVLVRWKEGWRGRKLSGNKDDNSIASPAGFDSCFIPYFLARHFHQATHWKYVELPAAPQQCGCDESVGLLCAEHAMERDMYMIHKTTDRPPDGCFCSPEKCMAPVIIGKQMPCRDPRRQFNTGPMANVTKGGMARFLKDRELPKDSIRRTPKTPTEESPYVHCLECGSPMHYTQGTCPSCGRKEF
jgi:hypothetical protein